MGKKLHAAPPELDITPYFKDGTKVQFSHWGQIVDGKIVRYVTRLHRKTLKPLRCEYDVLIGTGEVIRVPEAYLRKVGLFC